MTRPLPSPLPRKLSRRTRLVALLGANLVLVGLLFGVGLAARSLGVWAEGADYLADAVGIGASLVALHLAGLPATERRPRGHPLAAHYVALANAAWVLVVSLAVVGASAARLVAGAEAVHGLPVLVVSGVAAVTMGCGVLVLVRDSEDDGPGHLNVRAALLDTAGDAAAAAAVAVTGAVIYLTHGLYWLDPAVGLVISLSVAQQAVGLLRQIWTAMWRAGSSAPPRA